LSEIRALFKQSSHYFAGHVAIMAVGFISFPILTRIFSVSDYGILGLITTTLLIAIAISKLGYPGFIVQCYAEFKAKNEIERFYSTMFLSALGIAGSLAIVFYIALQFIPNRILDKSAVSIMPIVSILIFTTCTSDILTSFLRAEQRTKLLNLVAIIRRYGAIGLGVFFVFFFVKGLNGFYFGQMLVGMIIFSFLVYQFVKRQRIDFACFSTKIFKDAMKFGFPLVLAELGHLLLNYADRYLIQLYLGSVSLGLYTAGYNLATHVTEVIIYPVAYAHTPIYMNILVNRGEKETKEFLTKVFTYFLLAMIPLVFGFMAIGKDLISVLASRKYEEVYTILGYVVVGQSIYACSLILNDGLLIRKKTYILRNVIIIACFVNVGINIILIPRYGILGAAQATLISNIFHTIVITYYAFKEFSFRIDYARIILYLVSSLVMFMVIRNIHLEGRLLNLVGKVGIGAIIYFICIFVFDREIRSKLRSFGKNLKKT
jgi:O-antigen/teichoic acid export membrane protein